MSNKLYTLLFLTFFSCQSQPQIEETPGHNVQFTGVKHHVSTEKELDQLFVQLQAAKDAYVIRRTQQQIQDLWMNSGNDQLDTLMAQGLRTMYAKSYTEAIHIFTQVTEQHPTYVEGWNQRATVYFLKGNYAASLQDIQHTLQLEPRHFGALSGQASIYMMQGKKEQALGAYQKLNQLIPQLTVVQEQIEVLQARLGYRQI